MRANVYETMYVGLRRQYKEAKAILAEEDVPIAFSPLCSQELPEENFPEVVLLVALGVRKCHSCKGEIISTKCPPQRIWFFACRHFKYGRTKKLRNGANVTAVFIFT